MWGKKGSQTQEVGQGPGMLEVTEMLGVTGVLEVVYQPLLPLQSLLQVLEEEVSPPL